MDTKPPYERINLYSKNNTIVATASVPRFVPRVDVLICNGVFFVHDKKTNEYNVAEVYHVTTTITSED